MLLICHFKVSSSFLLMCQIHLETQNTYYKILILLGHPMINLIIIKQNSKISNVDKCLPFCSFKLIEFIRLQREKCTKMHPSAQKSSQFLIFMSIFHKTWWYFIFAKRAKRFYRVYQKVLNFTLRYLINV